jgi:hypothetical protein
MTDALRKPLFLFGAALLALAVLMETGSPLLNRLSQRVGVAAAEVSGLLDSAARLPQLKDVPIDEITSRTRGRAERPPGRGIPYLALLDGLLLFTVGLIGTSLLVPERVQGRIQGVVTLLVSLSVLGGAVVAISSALAAVILMVTLFLAAPFGTIVYLVAYGHFDRGLASLVSSVVMTLKLGFAGCLAFAHQGFLQMKGLVLIVLTSFIASIVVSFLHGLVPTILVSITDAIAGIVVAVLAALWAIFFLVGSIPSIIKSIKLKA